MVNIGDMAICLECGMEYEVKRAHQKYCHRRCFRKANYDKNKTSKRDTTFPSFICSVCGAKTKLDFNILEHPLRWENFQCSKCLVYNFDTIDPAEILFTNEPTEITIEASCSPSGGTMDILISVSTSASLIPSKEKKKKRKRKAEWNTAVCPECNKSFERNGEHKIFCHPNCAKRNRYKKNK